MQSIIYILLVLLLANSCQKQTAESQDTTLPVQFITDQKSYSEKDNISLILKNESKSDVIIGMRCGKYLETSWQQEENGSWSEDRSFPYMNLRCMTVLDTIRAHETFRHVLEGNSFDKKGTYRFLIRLQIPAADSVVTVFSNSFRIE